MFCDLFKTNFASIHPNAHSLWPRRTVGWCVSPSTVLSTANPCATRTGRGCSVRIDLHWLSVSSFTVTVKYPKTHLFFPSWFPKGYDFQFLRRSRLYETCGNTTGFSWTTQMVGGQALAVCEPSETAVSGAESAYFPANSSCLHTLAFSEPKQLNIFLKELAEQGVDISNHDKQADCLMCGY
eukprot:XP_027315834.1 uncharacterized protein LOC101798065 isoform X2 [Anas platyrhynchos]